jgi:membrane carboxypeptidase/penicillin-binding protein
VPSLALGSGEVTMLALVSAYGAFANGGTLVEPLYIKRVTTSSGEVLYESTPVAREVVTPVTAYMVTSMLEDVVDAGTGSQVRRMGFGLPAAGKTGTTNEYRDAWFVGYTPRVVTGVWVGYDQPRTIIPDGYAAQLAVPMWTRFMTTVTKGHRPDRFDAPRGVVAATICPLSGKLATDACYRNQAGVYTEVFAHGTEPGESCPYHTFHAGQPVTLVAGPTAPGTEPILSGAPGRVITSSAPAAGSPAADSADATTQEAPPKKRGFWGRIFGRR